MSNEMLASIRHFAAIRAHRTRLVAQLDRTADPCERAGLEAMIADYDNELTAAPAKPKRVPANRNVAALKAHRTRLAMQLHGTRGKERAGLKAMITDYDERIAA